MAAAAVPGPALGAPLRVARDCRIAPRIATLLDRPRQAQRLAAPGVPPFQERRFIGIEETAATVTTARPLWHGGRAERAKHRPCADAQLGGNGLARPPLCTQRPHLLMVLDPARPTLEPSSAVRSAAAVERLQPRCRLRGARPGGAGRH